MATVYDVDGSRRLVQPAQPPTFTLQELQHLVGGDIECVFLSGSEILVINEEGKLQGLPYNRSATQRVADRLVPGDYIAGPAVLVTEQEMGE